jgi:hypothetical protein
MRAVAVVAVLVAGALTACGDAGSSRDASARPPDSGCPDVDASPGGKAADPVKDPGFWAFIRQACEVSNDGDEQQAAALRHLLQGLEPAQVRQFHLELRRANRALYTREFVRAANHACRVDDLGLGADLGTDYRSWTIAHGRAAYEAVLADPQALADLPDAERGCGMGQAVTYAAVQVYDDLTGLDASSDRLPQIEPTGAPR